MTSSNSHTRQRPGTVRFGEAPAIFTADDELRMYTDPQQIPISLCRGIQVLIQVGFDEKEYSLDDFFREFVEACEFSHIYVLMQRAPTDVDAVLSFLTMRWDGEERLYIAENLVSKNGGQGTAKNLLKILCRDVMPMFKEFRVVFEVAEDNTRSMNTLGTFFFEDPDGGTWRAEREEEPYYGKLDKKKKKMAFFRFELVYDLARAPAKQPRIIVPPLRTPVPTQPVPTVGRSGTVGPRKVKSDIIETFTGDASVTRQLLDKIGTCFVSGNDADPVVLRILEDHVMLREADDDDKRAHELSELKLLKAETVKAQHTKVVAAAAEAAATPAKLVKPSTKTPPSLPEDATPAEKYFASKLKDVASMQATHTGKLDGIQYSVDEEGTKAQEARDMADVAFAEAHQERVKAQDHRDTLEEQRLDDKQAAAEQQLNEVLAEQAKTKAAKEAKNEALKAEQLKMEQLKASMTAEFKASEARQRSAIKSVSNDNCKIITTAIAETFHKGEEELNATFDSGVDAGITHEAQAEKARKEAAMAKRFGKSKVLAMAAEIENTTATNTTATTATPAPASASSSEAKPRRSARVASNTNTN